MKKILLGTTTLIGAAGLMASAALAETPKVTIGGDADFQLGWVSEDLDAGLRSQAFRSDTTLKFRIDGRTDGGLGYGGGIDLRADVTEDPRLSAGTGGDASRTFLYFDGTWGRLSMGSELGAETTMKVDAASIARATGGIDGDWVYFATVGATGTFWGTPDLVLAHGGRTTGAAGLTGGGIGGMVGSDDQENLNKVTYYTPRFAGFQLGVSYIPSSNPADRGITISRADTTVGDAENIWTGGLSYEGKWDQVGFAAAVTGEHGSSEEATTEDLRAWQAGAKVSYMGFSVAGSWADLNDSLQAVGGANDDIKYWTLGAAYETGPFGASVTYIDSEVELAAGGSDELNNLSFGVDYKLAPGMTPYAEVSFVEMDGAAAGDDNDATVFIVGSQLSF